MSFARTVPKGLHNISLPVIQGVRMRMLTEERANKHVSFLQRLLERAVRDLTRQPLNGGRVSVVMHP
jgi:hypothetical protein